MGVESVFAAVHAELLKLQAPEGTATDTSEGQIALNLAAVLDDRAGIQGVAATAKQLQALLVEIREKYQPKGRSRLELLRGGDSRTG